MDTLNRSAAPPADPPADARFLRRTLWLLLIITLGFRLSYDWLGGPPLAWYEDYPLIALLVLIAISALYLLHRKQTDAALTIFLWGLTCAVLLQCALVMGLRTPVAIALPIPVILSAWSLRPKQTILLASLVIAAITVMAVFDSLWWPTLQLRGINSYYAVLLFSISSGYLLARHLSQRQKQQLSDLSLTRDELRQRVQDLQIAQEKFATFFYLNPVPVSISRIEDGRYIDVNPAWESIAGWSREETIGRSSLELNIWVDQAERQAWIAEFRKHGRTHNQLTRFRLRNGSIRYFLASSEVINYDGQRCIFAAFVDVTERREAEEAVRQLNAQLEARVNERTQSLAEANQSLAQTITTLQQTQDELIHAETMASLGSMVAGISHELNTPIGNALTVSTALQDQARDFNTELRSEQISRKALHSFIQEQQSGAEIAVKNLLRAAELINSFKQVAVDQASERRRGFELAGMLQDLLTTLRPTLKLTPFMLHTELAEGIAMDSFPGPLGQVLSNLIQNALIHGLEGASEGHIWLTVRALDAERAEIIVRDSGNGISAENLPRIFDPFFTTRLGRGGSGLGLSIVHRIVTRVLGGTISASSKPGQGAEFCINIPRIAPQATPE